MRTVSTFTVEEGERVPFVLTWFPSHGDLPPEIDAEQAFTETDEFWREWVGACKSDIPDEWRSVLIRSLIVLKALIYEPTGGIVAAPTTSLPEWIGGVRNWDYRYCWLRDATLTLLALLHADYQEEAKAWRTWLVRAVAGDPADIQVMYGVAGERRLTELELPWLVGYEGLDAGSHRQCRERAAPDRRLRRGDRCALSGARARTGVSKEPLGPAGRAPRASGARLARARRGDLGDSRRAAALRPLEGHGVGGIRPVGALRGGAEPSWPGRPVAGTARRDPCGRSRERLRRRVGILRAVVWLEGPRREPPADSARRLPACVGSARARHDRGDRAEPRRRRLRPAVPHDPDRRRRLASRRGRVPAVLVLARRLPRAHRQARRRARAVRASPRVSRTTWDCCRRSTTRRRSVSSGTSRRRSRISHS